MIIRSNISKESIYKKICNEDEDKQYETFIAYNRKNKKIEEISCAPECLASYFEEDSALPFEISPAFFNPEILAKYKANPDKYKIEHRRITCRDTWQLRTFDINKAGQVHTYLRYLKELPYEEQQYWKSFNEPPIGSISARAFQTDIMGEYSTEPDPLQNIISVLQNLKESNTTWWQVKSEKLFSQVQYPITEEKHEWASAIVQLDQLIIEGFNYKFLQKKLREKNIKPNSSSLLGLLKENLIGMGYETDLAEKIIYSFKNLRRMRNKIVHVEVDAEQEIKRRILKEHGTYRNHFEALCEDCHESLVTLKEAFEQEN